MAIEAKEVVFYIRKGLMFSIKTSYRTARDHPSITFIFFLLLIIYRAFPSLFAFLVTSSPVIFCTALLLGTLLSYGTPDIPDIGKEEKKTHEISSLQVGSTVDDCFTKKDEAFTAEARAVNESVRDVPLIHDTLPSSLAAIEESEKVTTDGREVCDHGLTVHITKPASENLVDSSLGSPWQPINTHDASSGSDSDSSGSSSPDASMADIIPMLDELHPQIGKEAEEEEHDDNQDVVTWTADDQKNVMDLGVSEVERNWRLESLAAEWRAGKVQGSETGKNLDFLDGYYDAPMTSVSAPRHNPFDISHDSVPGSAPSVLQPRQNPFDLPYDQVEKISSLSRDDFGDLHDDNMVGVGDVRDVNLNTSAAVEETPQPIDSFGSLEEEIGEAPANLHAGLEVIDTEHVEQESKSFLEVDSVDVQNDLGSLDVGDDRAVNLNTSIAVEETRQPTDSFSSLEEEIGEAPANLPAGLEVIDNEHVEQESKSYLEVDSVDVQNDLGSSDVGDDRAVNLNTLIAVEETRQPTDSFSASEEEIGEAPASLLVSDFAELEVIEESYEESNSSSSEENDKISGIAINEESPNLDEDLLYEGKEDLISTSLASDVKADFLDVASPPKPLEMDLDEAEPGSVEVSKASEDVPESAVGATVHSSIFSPVESESDEVRPIGIDKSSQSEGYDIMDVLPPTSEDESHVSILDLSSIPEENVDGFKFEEVHGNTIESVSKEVNPVMDQLALLDIEAESSVFPPRDDPEMTVYNPKLHVLEASSLEELDSFFKLHLENPVEPSSSTVFDSSEVGASELDVVKETDSQFQVIEAKSIEDIDLALKKLNEGGLRNPGFSEVETNVGLEFLEAKSLEDINLAFKQLSEGSIKSPTPPELMEHEGESSERHLESEVSNSHQEPELSEVQYVEEMDSKETIGEVTGTIVEKIDEKSDVNTNVNVVPDPSAPVSRKSRKKFKPVKSGSGSSSSSSSSSSDSE